MPGEGRAGPPRVLERRWHLRCLAQRANGRGSGTVIKDEGAFASAIGKDLLAYARFALDECDEAFLRVCNEPRRGLGNLFVEKLRETARERGCSLFAALDSFTWWLQRLRKT